MIERRLRAGLGCLTGIFFLGAVVFLWLQRAHQVSPMSGGCGMWFIADLGMTAVAALFGAAIGQAAGAASSLGESVRAGVLVPIVALVPFVVLLIWDGTPARNLEEKLQFLCVATAAGGLCAAVSHVVAGLFPRSPRPVNEDDENSHHPAP